MNWCWVASPQSTRTVSPPTNLSAVHATLRSAVGRPAEVPTNTTLWNTALIRGLLLLVVTVLAVWLKPREGMRACGT